MFAPLTGQEKVKAFLSNEGHMRLLGDLERIANKAYSNIREIEKYRVGITAPLRQSISAYNNSNIPKDVWPFNQIVLDADGSDTGYKVVEVLEKVPNLLTFIDIVFNSLPENYEYQRLNKSIIHESQHVIETYEKGLGYLIHGTSLETAMKNLDTHTAELAEVNKIIDGLLNTLAEILDGVS
jgi:hypothetical protein